MSSYQKASRWRRLSVFDGRRLKEHWSAPIRKRIHEPLLNKDCCDTCEQKKELGDRSDCWAVESYLELIRLVGALQHQNPQCTLLFRGERKMYSHATPKAFRKKRFWSNFKNAADWMESISGKGRLLCNRSELARWAILQHYGAATPLLDVTTSLRIAATFALKKPTNNRTNEKPSWCGDVAEFPQVSVFAVPRLSDSINIFLGIGICLVDLVADLPSSCLRPHLQRAVFLGLTDAVMAGIDSNERKPSKEESCLSCLRIAKICLKSNEFEIPSIEQFFPPASKYTTIGHEKDDMSGDYLLRALWELNAPSEKWSLDFPSYYWEAS